MSGQQIEIILSRQLADCLSVPVFLTDPNGNLLFYNEPAEQLLGLRFEETGPMTAAEWGSAFHPVHPDGSSISAEDLPLLRTLKTLIPEHGEMCIKSTDGSLHDISVTSYPIVGRPCRVLGAMAIFWEKQQL